MSQIHIDDLEPVSATDAKVKFGEILHETSVNGKKFIVDRHGKPVSVILSYREYRELLEGKKGHRNLP
jgi:prevent-host-death family protein